MVRWWIWLGAVHEKRDGEHGVRFGMDGFGEGWTPVRRRRQNGKRDLEMGGLRLPVDVIYDPFYYQPKEVTPSDLRNVMV